MRYSAKTIEEAKKWISEGKVPSHLDARSAVCRCVDQMKNKMDYLAKREELNKCRFVTASWARGYISRGFTYVFPYKGRYGEGYTVAYQTTKSNRYYRVEYWVK